MAFLDLSSDSIAVNVAVFVAAAAVIAYAGTKLASLADRLADRTGLGEAVTGTVFLGFATALPGLAASITAALEGHPALAISNAIGGIAIQTAFLAAGDVVYRKANLEHAAASAPNMVQTAMLVILLALVMTALTGPDRTVAHVHLMTPTLLIVAAAGFWLVYRSRRDPMWKPKLTKQTVEDVPNEEHLAEHLGRLIAGFVVNASLVVTAGALVAHTVGNFTEQLDISQTIGGSLFSATATSLPELVTTIAAVRRGALTLAVSDIVGGNFFDVLFVFAADLVFLDGSLYHAAGVTLRESFMVALCILMNATLLLGLLYRQREGPANIGFESVLIVAQYLVGILVLGFWF